MDLTAYFEKKLRETGILAIVIPWVEVDMALFQTVIIDSFFAGTGHERAALSHEICSKNTQASYMLSKAAKAAKGIEALFDPGAAGGKTTP